MLAKTLLIFTANAGDIMSEKFKQSSFLGWLAAGSDLLAAQIESASGIVSKKLDNAHSSIDTLQARGAQVEVDLKRKFGPDVLIKDVKKFVSGSPFYSLIMGSKSGVSKEEQLDLLSDKVDLLVEQVALLAEKQVAAKAAEKKPVRRKAVTTKPATSRKPTAKVATKPKASPAVGVGKTPNEASTAKAKAPSNASKVSNSTVKPNGDSKPSAPVGTDAAKQTQEQAPSQGQDVKKSDSD